MVVGRGSKRNAQQAELDEEVLEDSNGNTFWSSIKSNTLSLLIWLVFVI